MTTVTEPIDLDGVADAVAGGEPVGRIRLRDAARSLWSVPRAATRSEAPRGRRDAGAVRSISGRLRTDDDGDLTATRTSIMLPAWRGLLFVYFARVPLLPHVLDRPARQK
jgi:hypothetical protein